MGDVERTASRKASATAVKLNLDRFLPLLSMLVLDWRGPDGVGDVGTFSVGDAT